MTASPVPHAEQGSLPEARLFHRDRVARSRWSAPVRQTLGAIDQDLPALT